MKDLQTGKTLAEKIERVGSVVWATDNKTLFYTTEDAVSKRSDKFWRHAVGARRAAIWCTRRRTSSSTSAPARSLDKKVIFLGIVREDVDRAALPAGRRSRAGA